MKRILAYFVACIVLAVPVFTYASTTVGTIDSTNRYAWNENTGWIDFGTTEGAVTVTDSALTGYAYGENVGWISLNCSNTSSCGSNPYAVVNNGSGALSGYAWSENTGWIDFAPADGGVSISSSGIFSGYAYSENTGWINFTTQNPATTDWRPASVRDASVPSSGGSNSSSSGGGSVSSSVLASLLAPSASTTAYLDSLTNHTPTTGNCPVGFICTPTSTSSITPWIPASAGMTNSVFTRNLTLGSIGSDVTALQHYLNTHGFPLASSGPGSPGHETTKFGLLTQAALVKFQKANNITPSVGYFGVKTRAFINNH